MHNDIDLATTNSSKLIYHSVQERKSEAREEPNTLLFVHLKRPLQKWSLDHWESLLWKTEEEDSLITLLTITFSYWELIEETFQVCVCSFNLLFLVSSFWYQEEGGRGFRQNIKSLVNLSGELQKLEPLSSFLHKLYAVFPSDTLMKEKELRITSVFSHQCSN